MSRSDAIVVFRVGDQRFGIMADFVQRVVNAVALTQLPDAPAIVDGLVNIGGEIVPAISMRRRAGLSDRPIRASDCLLIADTPLRTVALVADGVESYLPLSSVEMASGDDIPPEASHMAGVAKQPDGLIVIYDLARFLSLDEERDLALALQGHTG